MNSINDFEEKGYEILDNFISIEQVNSLLDLLSTQQLQALKAGIRKIEQRIPEIAELAHSERFLSIAQQYLAGNPALVRAIYFDKSLENNWSVTWHQDRTVSVSKKFMQPDWCAWSIKAGAWHVQPPLDVLQQTVTIRIHLDTANKRNGCLKIMPKSHLLGIVETNKVSQYINKQAIVYCEVSQGGAVIMRPHILHCSEKALDNSPRRVLHFEYSSFQLPKGVTWIA